MAFDAVPSITLPCGDSMPALGQGTAGLAEGRHPAEQEIATLRLGLDVGMSLIDTAESYADGQAERLVGVAIARRRDEVFLVGKVHPANASRDGTAAACERSLERLGTDRLDLYLLHWRGEVPLEVTVTAFEELRDRGLIRHWGVGNFSVADLADLAQVDGGQAVQADQVVYNLVHRGIEWDLLPVCAQSGLPLMASAPLQHGHLVGDPVLRGIAVRHRVSSAQVALAWVLGHAGVNTHPRAGSPEHVERNRAALDLRLSVDDMVELDAAFEPPLGPVPLTQS